MTGFSGFADSTITLADRRFLIRRANSSDVPRLVSLLRDDALGAGREGASTEEEAGYQHAFSLIESDPNQLLVAIDDVSNESVNNGSVNHESVNHRAGGQAQASDTRSAAVVGTLQLTLIPSLSRRGSPRLQIEAVRIGPDAQRFYARLGYEASHEGLKLALD